jgi:Zn-dependent peptidase ImmA (M78 family)
MALDRENEIISTVNYLHHRLQFREPPFSIQDFFNTFPYFQLKPARLPRGYEGELLIQGQQKIIRYRIESREPRSRHTIAHEIGHAFLHAKEEFCCHLAKAFSLFKSPPLEPKEWEAEFFAFELLAPLPMLDRYTPALENLDKETRAQEVKRLALLFGIPTLAMRTRVRDLEKWRIWEEDAL